MSIPEHNTIYKATYATSIQNINTLMGVFFVASLWQHQSPLIY